MSKYWQGKRAVVVGGSRGLGLAIAETLSQHGAIVVLAARSLEGLESAAPRFATAPNLAICDATSDADVNRLVEHARDRLGGIDVWVNAVGKSSRGPVSDTSLEEFRAMWEMNFLTAVRCSQAVLPHLRDSKGHLVNIGSLASKVAPRWLAAYPTSKFPLVAYCQQLRLEESESGAHILLVCPGPLTRADAGQRYAEQAEQAQGMPEEARKPGGGAKIKTLDPHKVAQRVLQACERRAPELVLPGRARLLAAICQLAPSWGDWLLRRNSS